MTYANFTVVINDIRTALKNAQQSTLSGKTVNAVPIRDMVDELTQKMKQQAEGMDQAARETLASELLGIADDLDALERLLKQCLINERSMEGND